MREIATAVCGSSPCDAPPPVGVEAGHAFVSEPGTGRLACLDVRSGIDGCFGGDGTDDVLTDCYEAAGVWNVSSRLLGEMSWDLVEELTFE